MPPQPPSFGSRQYWDARFSSNSHPFEWLEAPTALDPYLVEALSNTDDQNPQLLHIGCGTSLLSYHIRTHVKDPEQVHNLDYSQVAIDIGRKREGNIYCMDQDEGALNDKNGKFYDDTSKENNSNTIGVKEQEARPVLSQPTPSKPLETKYMRWSSTDLLDHSSLLQVCKPATYSVVVDKSTSDSIACAEDVHVSVPYPVQSATAPNPLDNPSSLGLLESPKPIHPLHILAIHLALVTKPGAHWIALSYSQDRYPFFRQSFPSSLNNGSISTPTSTAIVQDGAEDLDHVLNEDLDGIPQSVIDSGFPNPADLWRLKVKHEIDVPPKPDANKNSNEVTHRPRVVHWVYVLERTHVPVFVRKQ